MSACSQTAANERRADARRVLDSGQIVAVGHPDRLFMECPCGAIRGVQTPTTLSTVAHIVSAFVKAHRGCEVPR